MPEKAGCWLTYYEAVAVTAARQNAHADYADEALVKTAGGASAAGRLKFQLEATAALTSAGSPKGLPALRKKAGQP